MELAQSSNSKVVVVGGGKDQLPLILGSDIASARPERRRRRSDPPISPGSPTSVDYPPVSSFNQQREPDPSCDPDP